MQNGIFARFHFVPYNEKEESRKGSFPCCRDWRRRERDLALAHLQVEKKSKGGDRTAVGADNDGRYPPLSLCNQPFCSFRAF